MTSTARVKIYTFAIFVCRQRDKIQATKAPQVLKISHDDHDDAISLSEDDDESIETGSEVQSDGDFELSLPKEILNRESASPLPDSGISSDLCDNYYGKYNGVCLNR